MLSSVEPRDLRMAGPIFRYLRLLTVIIRSARQSGAMATFALALALAPAIAEKAPVTVLASHIENTAGSTRLVFDITGPGRDRQYLFAR